MKALLVCLLCSSVTACAIAPAYQPSRYTLTSYSAQYVISLQTVERPAKASKRYGPQKVDKVADNEKYNYVFEDNLVKILWVVTGSQIGFALHNKTTHSIKIPWDEAAFVDESGTSHRVMHSGIKYVDRQSPMPASVVVRGGAIEDIVFPTDYVYWKEGTQYSAGSWEEKSLLLAYDSKMDRVQGTTQTVISSGTYPSLEAFDQSVQKNVGKSLQVLLPLEIEDVVNDYLFTFKVASATTKEQTR